MIGKLINTNNANNISKYLSHDYYFLKKLFNIFLEISLLSGKKIF